MQPGGAPVKQHDRFFTAVCLREAPSVSASTAVSHVEPTAEARLRCQREEVREAAGAGEVITGWIPSQRSS